MDVPFYTIVADDVLECLAVVRQFTTLQQACLEMIQVGRLEINRNCVNGRRAKSDCS